MNTKGIGSKKFGRLLREIKSIHNFSEKIAAEVLGKNLGQTLAKTLQESTKEEDEIIKLIERHSINFVTLEDENYPQSLRNIEDSPLVLFYKGDLPKGAIGIVGTRSPSDHSLQITGRLIEEKGSDVISGGARGIDLKAHEEALKQGFKTFVILGSGILNLPFGVKKLMENHRSGVSLISEFLPTQRANRYTFPKRNRIIAALSEEIYVIEAGEKSGALITAKYGVRYGKVVFVYVGDYNSERWAGCVDLLRRGLAREYNPNRKEGNELIEFLRKPRTYEEIVLFLRMNRVEVLKILSEYMTRGVVKKEGAYYISA